VAIQNCNIVYITREWCSKQREQSFCYCWNLFVCNTAIAFFFFFFSLPFKFARAVFNRIVNNMFVFLLCASVFLIYIVFNRIVNNMFVLPGLFFFFFLNFTLNSRKSWREKVYINCCFEYEV
jgi:hypothetical protein